MHRSAVHVVEHLLEHREALIHDRRIVGQGHEVVGGALEQESARSAPPGDRSGRVLAGVVEEAHFRDAADAADHLRIAALQGVQAVQPTPDAWGTAPRPATADDKKPRNAPLESPFAPSAVSTFTTNFLLVTVDKCYVRIAHITLKNKDEELVNPTALRSLYK